MRHYANTSMTERWGRPAALALLITLVALAMVWTDLPHRSSDSGWYLMMAGGEQQDVPEPFAGRLVHTGLARLLVHAGMDAEWAFISLAILALWITLAAVFWLHNSEKIPNLTTAFIVLGWLALSLLRDATLPDIHAAAWLSAILVVAAKRSRWIAPLLVGAILCRASLALFALVLVWIAWRDRRSGFALMIVAAAATGFILKTFLSGSENVHSISGPIYLATKSVFNFSRNVLGWELYVNTIDYSEPTHIWTLPAWVPSGGVTEVGVCGFNPRRPLWLLAAWSGVFGVLPGYMWARREKIRSTWPEAPLWLKAVLAYGLIMTLMAPAEGTMLNRLVGYGWPAFWLAAPLMAGPLTNNRQQLVFLGIMHATAALAVPLLAESIPWTAAWSVPALGGIAMVGIGLNIGAARLIRCL